jgi:hypothetical protein
VKENCLDFRITDVGKLDVMTYVKGKQLERRNAVTIDERLEKLTERHEALVQYTALKYRMDQERHEALAQSVEHEQRLSNLEG